MADLSRRTVLTAAAGALFAAAGPKSVFASAGPAGFPSNFLWGTSTSALQIEGAVAEDGRGPSIWERFAQRPGAIADGSSPDVACDHYHRWAEDVALMRSASLNAYRFSIAWPRVMPFGKGPVNARGLAFYDRLVDGLLESGIRPMACLYHWDLPQSLQDGGGWLNRDIADRFADYSLAVVGSLGDRVKDWFALNEPSVAAIFGHAYAEHAPGLNGGKAAMLAALHHQNLAQGKALCALRALRSDLRLGTVLSLQPVLPVSENEQDRAAALRWDAAWNRVPLDGVIKGELPDLLAGDMAGLIRSGDLEVIRVPLDMLGVNYYSPLFIQYQPGRLLDAGFGPVRSGRRTAMGWPVDPEGLRTVLTELRTSYSNPPVLITENGIALEDQVENGRVRDDERIAYIGDHLRAVRQAIKDGSDVRGYLAWSLLDNWEWQFGFRPRFGLVHVDYSDQRRTPKESLAWFGGLIRGERPL